MRPKVRGTCEGSLGLLPPGSDPVRNLAAPRARTVYPACAGMDARRRTQWRIVTRSTCFSTLGACPGWGGGFPAKLTTTRPKRAVYRRLARTTAAFAADVER